MTGPQKSTPSHISVLCQEVLDALDPKSGEVYVDATFGAGGYSRAVLGTVDCTVIAIDRDPLVAEIAAEVAADFRGKLKFIGGRFGEMDELVREAGYTSVDGVAMDVGVSSMQLDQADRGFSFRNDGPLDMRMSGEGPSAADLVNDASESDLVSIIREYGDEPRARRIAAAIVAARTVVPLTRTGQLAAIIEKAAPVRYRKGKKVKHPATRTFQALRIYVNDELGELRRGLAAAERILRPGGKLAVVSFHSLEDRIVKTFLAERSGGSQGSRHLPPRPVGEQPVTFTLTKRSAIKPGEQEIKANPRARSARLRVGVRTDAAPLDERRAA